MKKNLVHLCTFCVFYFLEENYLCNSLTSSMNNCRESEGRSVHLYYCVNDLNPCYSQIFCRMEEVCPIFSLFHAAPANLLAHSAFFNSSPRSAWNLFSFRLRLSSFLSAGRAKCRERPPVFVCRQGKGSSLREVQFYHANFELPAT